jgi:putative transposase
MRYRRVVLPGATYFFTLITYQRAPLFSDESNVQRWHRAVAKVQRARPFVVEAEVVLPDHLHMLWTMPDADADYATRMRLIKTVFTKDRTSQFSSRSANESRASKGEGTSWQRRYWEHVIRDERDFQAHLDYIHINPVQHGLVARARDWPYSTFASWLERGAYEPWWGTGDMPPLPAWAGRE